MFSLILGFALSKTGLGRDVNPLPRYDCDVDRAGAVQPILIDGSAPLVLTLSQLSFISPIFTTTTEALLYYAIAVYALIEDSHRVPRSHCT